MAQTKAREAEQKHKTLVRIWSQAFCTGAISKANASRIKLVADVADITIVVVPSPGWVQCRSHCLKAGPFKAIRCRRVVIAHYCESAELAEETLPSCLRPPRQNSQ